MNDQRKTKAQSLQDLRKKIRLVESGRAIIALSAFLGLLFGAIYTARDALLIYDKSVLESLVFDLEILEEYIRLIVLVLFVAFGIVASRLFTERKQEEEAPWFRWL